MKKISLLLLFALFSSFFYLSYSESSKAQSAQAPVELFNFIGAEKSINRDNIQSRVSTAEVREREISINFDSVSFEMQQKLSLPLLDGKSHQ